MSRATLWVTASLLALATSAARGDEPPKTLLRFATEGPDGTSWAREIRSAARQLLAATGGEVGLKVYFGGIAGDDLQVAERIRLGQLDGVLSAGPLCVREAPSLRAIRLVGLYRSAEEAIYVATHLRPRYDPEFRRAGWVEIAVGYFGPTHIFSRRPVRSLADLLHDRFWQWAPDEVQRDILTEMGMHLVVLSANQAARAYADQRADGFLSLPSAALAFQWSAQSRYVNDFQTSYSIGCILLSTRAYEHLKPEHQPLVLDLGARMGARLVDVTKAIDEALLNGLFQQQGLVKLASSPSFRNEFIAAAAAARERLGEKLIPATLLKRVNELITEYRAGPRPPH